MYLLLMIPGHRSKRARSSVKDTPAGRRYHSTIAKARSLIRLTSDTNGARTLPIGKSRSSGVCAYPSS